MPKRTVGDEKKTGAAGDPSGGNKNANATAKAARTLAQINTAFQKTAATAICGSEGPPATPDSVASTATFQVSQIGVKLAS